MHHILGLLYLFILVEYLTLLSVNHDLEKGALRREVCERRIGQYVTPSNPPVEPPYTPPASPHTGVLH